MDVDNGKTEKIKKSSKVNAHRLKSKHHLTLWNMRDTMGRKGEYVRHTDTQGNEATLLLQARHGCLLYLAQRQMKAAQSFFYTHTRQTWAMVTWAPGEELNWHLTCVPRAEGQTP